MNESRKWSWTEFVLGWINKQFLVWVTSTVLVFLALYFPQISESIKKILVIVWGVISFCLFFYKAIHILIENGKLNIEASAKVGLNKEVKNG